MKKYKNFMIGFFSIIVAFILIPMFNIGVILKPIGYTLGVFISALIVGIFNQITGGKF